MAPKMFKRIPTLATVVLVVLVVAACAIKLRDDETQTNTSTPAGVTSDPLAKKLMDCRSVAYEQKDVLSECRKAWAEKRRQFLGQKAPSLPASESPQTDPSLFVAPKDESRLPSGYPPIQQTGKE